MPFEFHRDDVDGARRHGHVLGGHRLLVDGVALLSRPARAHEVLRRELEVLGALLVNLDRDRVLKVQEQLDDFLPVAPEEKDPLGAQVLLALAEEAPGDCATTFTSRGASITSILMSLGPQSRSCFCLSVSAFFGSRLSFLRCASTIEAADVSKVGHPRESYGRKLYIGYTLRPLRRNG